ncbi:MAG: UbiD family decarboxylase [Betaproteobacteria bacterium]|nr:UbiD family decarboxylase [Betaproteobacteria bacterium]
MPYPDLRAFLARLEQEGELAHVRRQVEMDQELGAVCRTALNRNGPALIFDNPAGGGMPVVVNILATRRRYALALDVPEDRIHSTWGERTAKPIAPVLVGDGPCQENVITGDMVDLSAITTPIFNELDGGKFITFGCHISKDPDSGERNCAVYRAQIYGQNKMGLHAARYRHLILHRVKRPAERFPIAVAIGCDPTIQITSCAPIAQGVDELAVAGGLRGAPVELVRCKTVPLEVPATSEIVIEGYLEANEEREEGPFGDFLGYYSRKTVQPVVTVTAITHRNRPIHLVSYEGKPPHDNAMLNCLQQEAEILRAVDLPGIRKLHVTSSSSGFTAIVSIQKRYEGFPKMMGMAILGTWASKNLKTVILVDEDIDPFNWGEVDWALATRFQPHRDIEVVREVIGCSIDPSIDLEEKLNRTGRTSKMIIDLTRYNASQYEPACDPRPDVLAAVQARWSEYGIP